MGGLGEEVSRTRHRPAISPRAIGTDDPPRGMRWISTWNLLDPSFPELRSASTSIQMGSERESLGEVLKQGVGLGGRNGPSSHNPRIQF